MFCSVSRQEQVITKQNMISSKQGAFFMRAEDNREILEFLYSIVECAFKKHGVEYRNTDDTDQMDLHGFDFDR
jgi:hypothetical protein